MKDMIAVTNEAINWYLYLHMIHFKYAYATVTREPPVTLGLKTPVLQVIKNLLYDRYCLQSTPSEN